MIGFSDSRDRRIAVVFLRPDCNMSCSFCITEDGFDSLSWEQATLLLDRLVEQEFDSVVLGGGEPFGWRPGVLRLAEEASRCGLHVQVGTNGISMPDDVTEAGCVDRWVLPLDSAERTVHDSLRQHAGSHHALILRRLEQLAFAGKEATVSTVVSARSRAELSGIARLLESWCARGGRLHAWHLYRFIPRGRGGRGSAGELGLSAEDYHAACDVVRALDLPFRTYKRPDMRHSRSVDFFWSAGGELRVGSEEWAREERRGLSRPSDTRAG